MHTLKKLQRLGQHSANFTILDTLRATGQKGFLAISQKYSSGWTGCARLAVDRLCAGYRKRKILHSNEK